MKTSLRDPRRDPRRKHFLMRLQERYGIIGSMTLVAQIEHAIQNGAGYGPIRSGQYDETKNLDWYYVAISADKPRPVLVLVGWHRIQRCPVTCLLSTTNYSAYQARMDASKAGLMPVDRLVIKRSKRHDS